jgi:2-methylcitrate dehydratase PrpD
MQQLSLTEKLVQLNRRSVDLRARQRAVLHWLDWIACVAAGSRAPAAQSLANWRSLLASGSVNTPAYWPALAGLTGSDMQAVWLDAGLANIEEMDDMHRDAILHPGPVVIPVVAHFARHANLTINQTLDALVRGYESMIRVGRSVGSGHYALWHNTATVGVFGAAAAAADALQLSDAQTSWALGNAGTQASGLWQVRLETVMSKQLHTGHAAWAGLTAAMLAQADFTGPRFILEGERGFFAALCTNARPERVVETASDWLIHSTSFKPWPSCRHTHATIDCVLALRESMGNKPMAFSNALIEGFSDALTICDNAMPLTRTQAKFSLQYCVAAAARWGRLVPEHFDEQNFSAPEMRLACARAQLRLSPELERAYPAHFGGRVTLTLADGSVHSASVADSLGDPERPMLIGDLFEKAAKLMQYGGVTATRSEAVLNATRSLLKMLDKGENPAFPRALLDPLF